MLGFIAFAENGMLGQLHSGDIGSEASLTMLVAMAMSIHSIVQQTIKIRHSDVMVVHQQNGDEFAFGGVGCCSYQSHLVILPQQQVDANLLVLSLKPGK